MATDKKAKHGDNYYLSLGISFGLLLGVGISLVLDNWAFIGAGMAFGVAIGVALDVSTKNEKPEPDAEGSPDGDGPVPGVDQS